MFTLAAGVRAACSLDLRTHECFMVFLKLTAAASLTASDRPSWLTTCRKSCNIKQVTAAYLVKTHRNRVPVDVQYDIPALAKSTSIPWEHWWYSQAERQAASKRFRHVWWHPAEQSLSRLEVSTRAQSCTSCNTIERTGWGLKVAPKHSTNVDIMSVMACR